MTFGLPMKFYDWQRKNSLGQAKQMIFLPPASKIDTKEGVLYHEHGVPLRGDAFEMVVLALREKARAADWIKSKLSSRFWS